MAYIVPLDKPKCCIECPFCSDKQYDLVDNGLYERIGRCVIAPEYDEETGEEIDAYRNVYWLSKNVFDWCPLKECNEILTPNEVRIISGRKPFKDPKADELYNKNLNKSNKEEN